MSAACLAGPALAADELARAPRYAPAESWIIAPPAASPTPTPDGAPVRMVYTDNQVRIGSTEQTQYVAVRMQLLTPEALQAGNLSIGWSPANEQIIVNRVAIWRAGKSIDVLQSQKFSVIQRENNLEQSILDGNLTATLQIAGLQVGDELEFAVSSKRRFTLPGERPETFMQFPIVGTLGTISFRVIESKGSAIAFRAASDAPRPVVRPLGGETEHVYQLQDPGSVTLPEGAPTRYQRARYVQVSGYADWAAVSRMFDPPFARAATLAPASPVKAEAARIAAATSDPAARTEAALRLVQEQIRYVYVGLNGGNYIPVTADETWARRFGDCKAKTALLIALLRELGIPAEPVLVSSKGGDGTDRWLPSPAAFDHVVVRATVGGKPVWLDGARQGDRHLADLYPPAALWGLPLRAAGAGLEPIAQRPLRLPHRIEVAEVDLTAGTGKPAKLKLQYTLRGEEIFAMRTELAAMVPADASKALMQYWRNEVADFEPAKVDWRFDADNRLLLLSAEGERQINWLGDATRGYSYNLYGGGFMAPDAAKRPADQPQDAPFVTAFPKFNCFATTVILPPPGKGFRWGLSSRPINQTLGGKTYWRISSLDGNVARLNSAIRVLTPEITAAEAIALNAAIDGFDNKMSYVWESPATRAKPDPGLTGGSGRFGSFADFAGPAPPCMPPGPEGTAVAAP